jgi:hypothetical protein
VWQDWSIRIQLALDRRTSYQVSRESARELRAHAGVVGQLQLMYDFVLPLLIRYAQSQRIPVLAGGSRVEQLSGWSEDFVLPLLTLRPP